MSLGRHPCAEHHTERKPPKARKKDKTLASNDLITQPFYPLKSITASYVELRSRVSKVLGDNRDPPQPWTLYYTGQGTKSSKN